ncbi:MAG TPA: patatin-like phospholipase family protein [Candidatus Acidoferrales bacterium]|nr:patatin-like phospholipase family protein [Candidatus Acidoferrales bacterium]
MRNILSIRGGGIRGIIPCCCLIRLEEQLGGLTRDHIHLCAGTSTGALLTASVAAGVPARDLLKVYTDQSHEIFTPSGVVGDAKRGVEGFTFDPTNLRDVLARNLGPAANWTVNDSPVRIMISATAMNGHNWFFVKDNERNSRTTGGVKLVDAAVASACAPTYFDHWRIDGIQGRTIRFFDGGVGGTANPAYQAAVEAFEYDDFVPRASRLISLGTGFYPASDDPPKGLIAVIEWVTSTLVDTSEDWVDEAVERQWPGLMQNFNPELPRDIDMADTSAIPDLVRIGQQTAAAMDWTQILK